MFETAGGGVNAPDTLHWNGCYEGGWQGDIVAGAFSHPAKVSRALIRRIYEHAFAEGWIHPGDTVIDPFGGIAGTALDAALRGVQWIGCELEPRFAELGNDNIKLWQSRFADLPAWRTPLLMCGDSRKLSEHVAKAMMVVSSPPYAVNQMGGGGAMHGKNIDAMKEGYGNTSGQLGEMKEGDAPKLIVSSPPYAETINSKSNGIDWTKAGRPDRTKPSDKRISPGVDAGLEYGETQGQLGAMKEGVAPALIVSSPPYAEIATGAGGLNHLPPKHEGQQGGRSGDSASQDTDSRYGASEGQLAKMVVGSSPYVDAQQLQDSSFVLNSTAVNPTPRKVGDRSYAAAVMDADGQMARMVVGSPPYEGTPLQAGGDNVAAGRKRLNAGGVWSGDLTDGENKGYGLSNGQIGGEIGETFWSAAAEIVEQCRIILQPGGHAIWVTKDFVRNKARVPFSDQWQALCESHGFRLVCRHQAMLVAHHGEQDDIFGASKALTTERKSFFRRLAEKKGSPRIDFEDVLCMERI